MRHLTGKYLQVSNSLRGRLIAASVTVRSETRQGGRPVVAADAFFQHPRLFIGEKVTIVSRTEGEVA